MQELLNEIKRCQLCLPHLTHGVNPILAASHSSKIAIIGHAPGSVVHKSGVPWEDKSGDRLRQWLAIDKSTFYDSSKFAIVPMGFCYPGKGKTGDLPPRPECAPKWHKNIFDQMPDLQLILLIGNYAQKYYLPLSRNMTLTARVKNYDDFLPRFFPLPHPSPRNNIWLKKNPWFAKDVLVALRKAISDTLT